MDRRRIVVVEDDPLTRGLIADLIDKAGFAVVTASNGSDARRACAATDPDGVVLDVDLGVGPTGFDVADALLAEYPHLAVLFLTNLPDARFAGRSDGTLPPGIGYLRKDRVSRPEVLVEALDQVLRGQARAEHRHDQDPSRPLAGLSATQISVLRMVALGMSNQQIADSRGTTVRAVQTVISRALAGLGVEDDESGNARVVAARNFMLAAGIPTADQVI